MADDFIHIEGEPINVGVHGQTDYVFSSGEPVPNTGKDGFVFESSYALGRGLILEDFEDLDKGRYVGDTDYLSQSSLAFEGDYGGELTQPNDDNETQVFTRDIIIERPVELSCMMRASNNDTNPAFAFFVQEEETRPEYYTIDLEFNDDNIEINYFESGDDTGGGTETSDEDNPISLDPENWYEFRVNAPEDGGLYGTLYDDDANEIQTATWEDDIASKLDSGGFGFRNHGDAGDVTFDFARIVRRE